MRPAVHVASLIALVLPFASACASAPAANHATPAGSDAKSKDGESDKARERADLEYQLTLAKQRLSVAEMESKAFEAEHAVRARHASTELELARAALGHFQEHGAPTRLAGAELDLQSAKDRAQEAEDELAQIEIMYKDQDLNDMTAEFVVSRGRRNAERAKARIAIQEAEFAALAENDLPQEQTRLELDVDRKSAALEALMRDDEVGRMQKEMAVREKAHEIEELERKLSDLDKGEKAS